MIKIEIDPAKALPLAGTGNVVEKAPIPTAKPNKAGNVPSQQQQAMPVHPLLGLFKHVEQGRKEIQSQWQSLMQYLS